MPVNNAELTIDFTSNSQSDHRVCWRVQGSGDAYDCSTVISCDFGMPCQAIISLYIDPETCEDIILEGYVQPTCQDITSPNNREEFTATFVSDPSCIAYLITCNSVGVDKILVTNGGSGYTAGATLPLTITRTDGTSGGEATADANVGSGFITGFTISNPGSNYAVSDVINVVDTGSGAGASLEVAAVDGGGGITDINILAPGDDYEGPSVGSITTVSGAGAVITLDTDYGVIITTSMTLAGDSYELPPNVTVGGVGAGATFEAVLEVCTDFSGTDCKGNFDNKIPSGPVGQAVRFCLESDPTLADTQSFELSGCCTDDCITYTVSNDSATDATINIRYIACGGDVVSLDLDSTIINAGVPSEFCAVADSIYVTGYNTYNNPEDVNITAGADCDA